MDILKILTRGIKQPLAKPGEAAASTNLPSAGNRTNPQLFHDAVGSRRGTKRKRAREVPDPSGLVDDAELDFFAPTRASAAEGETEAPAQQLPAPDTVAEGEAGKLMDEDECRQLLRSHRLKLTILAGRSEKPTKVGKRRKKGKAVEVEAKGDKEQVYPQPLRTFPELRHNYRAAAQLVDNITRRGFREPTEVQMGSLPLLLRPRAALKKSTDAEGVDLGDGVDFMAVAPTGSGKTISFLIPAITRVTAGKAPQAPGSEDRKLTAVVMAPTRELAAQIVNEGRKLAAGTGVRICLMRKGLQIATEDQEPGPEEVGPADGGESEGESPPASSDDESDTEQLGKGAKDAAPRRAPVPDILVTTPKSLLNLLSGGASGAKKVLPSVTSLILDEADVLLDPLFQKQTLAIWNACTHPSLQMSFWSATMASNIESLVTKQLAKRAGRLALPARPLVRLVVGLKDTAVPNVAHRLVYTATEAGKLLALRQLLHPVSGADSGPPLRPPFLVFTQTIERAQALHDELKYDIPAEAGGSARIAVLHSGLPERARAAVMARFRAGEVWVLITTDLLARGVDFSGVNGTVSYDVPASAAAYVHRAGRTGRAGREGGVAVTFYTKEDIPYVKSVANVIAASERQAGRAAGGLQRWLLDALPDVAKADKRRLKVRGVEARRTGGRATISTQSAWERRRENNRRGAIEGSKRRKREQRKADERAGGRQAGSDGEWAGLDG